MKSNFKAYLFLAVAIFVLNYSFLDSLLIKTFQNQESGNVTRIIDGDTIVVNSEKIRMLGINSPEKGELGYENAKKYLEDKILNKKVSLYFGAEKYDRYKRKLAYVFLESENINLESIRNGYSNYYFPSGVDIFSKSIKDAWNECLSHQKNLCKKSKEKCLSIKSLDIEAQELVLENKCSKSLKIENWSVKDEGRKKIYLTKSIAPKEKIILKKELWAKDYVWTKSGDSVFLRDEKGLLVDFYSY